MRRLTLLGALMGAAAALAASSAAGHNGGCVQAGNGEWVFVGSGNSGPFVPEQNPHYHAAPDGDQGRLDLQGGPGDQYGARFAVDRGNSAVEHPRNCAATR